MKYGLWKTFATQVKRIKEGQISYVYVIYIINALASGVIPVIGVFFIKIIIDEITMSNSIDGFLFKMLILIVISTICLVLKSILEGILSGKFLLLRQKEFEKVIHLYHTTRYENIENSEFQDTVNSATEALEGDGRGFEKTYSNFKIILTSLVSIILFSIILAYFNIILVIVCFLSTLLSIVINKKVADYNRKRQKDLAHASRQKNYYNNTASDFSYGKDTRIFSLKEFIMDKYNDKSLSYLKVLHDLYNKEFKYGLFGLITLLLQDGISYSIIVYSAIQGYITLSEVTLYISSIVAFTTVLRTLSDNITDLIKNLKLTMTYFEFLDSTEKEKKLNKWEFDYHEGVTIEFQNVWFKYPNTDSYIFENLNFKINKNEKIAIVGTNGAGKTTIVNLLMRFYEVTSGDILIDGVSIQEMKREEVHNLFDMILQDTWLFHGSVRENLVYNKENVTNETLDMVCKAVGLHHFIQTLPNGYDTILDDSINISEGQKQQLTIARAMIKDAPLLILDEATSSVDTRTEIVIQNAMDQLTVGRTSFVIAHRLSTIKNADIILVMNKGDIIEQGTHEQLLAKKGFYAELYNSQFEIVS